VNFALIGPDVDEIGCLRANFTNVG